jgi:hypothetical protein
VKKLLVGHLFKVPKLIFMALLGIRESLFRQAIPIEARIIDPPPPLGVDVGHIPPAFFFSHQSNGLLSSIAFFS